MGLNALSSGYDAFILYMGFVSTASALVFLSMFLTAKTNKTTHGYDRKVTERRRDGETRDQTEDVPRQVGIQRPTTTTTTTPVGEEMEIPE